MSEIWDTKDGPRRVRRDPPTTDDAVIAAQGLADDIDGQVEIVMSLMPVSAEVARAAVLKLSGQRKTESVTVAGRSGVARAVVVERRAPRRMAVPARASAGFRGR